ncbi:MAG: CHAT domain-containing protein, partial [Chloroflexia bacterium]|nr:CHAT domain-containing protein [Chloroflexia bacterium]
MALRLTNLGTGLRDRYVRMGRLEDLEQAQTCYASACEQGQLRAPEVALTAAQSWGRWASERMAWGEAIQAFEAGIATVEQLHRTQLRRSESETWLSEACGLHMHAAYALIQTGTPVAYKRAVEVAEIGRARGLGETLARDRSDLSEIERDHPEVYTRYRAAAEELRQIDQRVRGAEGQEHQPVSGGETTDLTARILAAREQLDAAITEIRVLPGYDSFLRPPTYAEIAAVAQPGVPLVYLISTPQSSLALIVSHSTAEPEALLLDGFTEDNLNALLTTREGEEVVGGYLPGQFGDHKMVQTALNNALPLLGERLIAPLAAQLKVIGARGITLIPTGLLSALPLHAATYAVDEMPRCLLDEFDVAYAPSALVLATAQREARQRKDNVHLVGVGNPTRDLRYAGAELAAICDLLPVGAATVLYEHEARRDALWQALPSATIGHFSCHGSFATDPLDSALHLAEEDRITLRDLVAGDTAALANLQLVVLSACQTAITDFQRLPDESIGLPGGFLQAGVPAVIGTLWSVDDLSTALLMHRFYEFYLYGDRDVG